MGRDKALLRLHGETIVERLARVAVGISPRAFVVVDGAQKTRGLNLRGAQVLQDAVPRGGPLGGIHTALQRADGEWNLFLTCDMPLVTGALLKLLLLAADAKHDAAHFTFADEPKTQPFPLLLHRNAARTVAWRIVTNRLSVVGVLDSLRVRQVRIANETDAACFLNVNTPSDWRRCQMLSRACDASPPKRAFTVSENSDTPATPARQTAAKTRARQSSRRMSPRPKRIRP